MVKSPPAKAGDKFQSQGQEDPLEKGMASHSRILAWEILQRSLAGYSPWGRRELDMTEQLSNNRVSCK